MLLYSFTDVVISIVPLFISGGVNWKVWTWFGSGEVSVDDVDPAPVEERIPRWWWVLGLSASIIMSCTILSTQVCPLHVLVL